jgi:HAE1 family hydrophobic/amphiphilic exporter-1
LEQLKVQDELTGIDVKFYQNQSRPQLDLIGQYGITGLAGSVSTATNPLLALNNILLDRVNQLSTFQGLLPLQGIPTTLPGSLIGGQGQAFSNLFSNNFRTVKIGISFNFIIHNRTAEGNLGHSLAQRRQISAQRQKAEEMVQVDVRNALQAVRTAQKRIEAARAARVASERQLESEVRQYQAGESTNFLVLTRQNDLSDIKGREIRALTDYNKAIADLQRAMATTLQSHNVVAVSPHTTN